MQRLASLNCWGTLLLVLGIHIGFLPSSAELSFAATHQSLNRHKTRCQALLYSEQGIEQEGKGVNTMRKVLFQGPLFGRLTKAGREYLLRHGWALLETNGDEAFTTMEGCQRHNQRLALIWPTKTGPQFEINDAMAAHIRPLPKHMTDVLDDKVRLAAALEGTSLAPPTVRQPFTAEVIDPDRLYFVKHRYGAQGKGVYVYNRDELLAWKERSQNSSDFVIQHEILPALYGGRKFVLRCHILLLLSSSSSSPTHARACNNNNDDNSCWKAYLHKSSIICQHHATTYRKGVSEKSSQVSQAGGKKHPAPILQHDLPKDHPSANAYNKIQCCCQDLIRAVPIPHSNTLAPETTCFALMGVDLMMDDNEGKIQVCEVNSHPALGWGTMSKVPKDVFVTLIEETLSFLVQNNDPEYADSNFDPLLMQ